MPSPWKLRFFTIWTGQRFSLLGSIIARFALVWWVTRETGSAIVLANATMVSLAPSILLGPFIGPLIDRWNRRIVMLVSDAFIAIVSLWLAYLFWSGTMQIWHVYVVMLSRAVGSAFYSPAGMAATSLMVPEQHLPRIAGLGMTINGLTGILGPALGAFFMELLPLHGVMMIDVGTAVCAILPLIFLHIPQPTEAHLAEIREGTYVENLRAGVRFVLQWPGLLVFLGGVGLLLIVLSPAFSFMPLLILEHFQKTSVEFGLYQSLGGAGVLLGGLILSAWGGFKKRIYTVLAGFLGLGVGVTIIGFTPPELFWLILVCSMLMGIMSAMFNGATVAILQASIPKHIQGRFFSLWNCLASLAAPIGLAIAGPLAERVGVPILFRAGGILCVGISLIGFFVPALRMMETRYADEIK